MPPMSGGKTEIERRTGTADPALLAILGKSGTLADGASLARAA